MLSERVLQLLQKTVPAMEEKGEAITRRFYPLLFSEHPELLHVFNHAHQHSGGQPKALADTLLAAARYAAQPERLFPLLRRIAHKHRSVGVKKEQYPIVGRILLGAMRETLGESIPEEVYQAWETAYQWLAQELIRMESELYRQAAVQPGGWDGFRPFTVVRKVKESRSILSIYLRPADGGAVPLFLPGQYVSVRLQIPGERYALIRQYSLSDAPGTAYFRISVKKEEKVGDKPAGKGSNYLHEQVHPGDMLMLSAPAGDFVLDMQSERPLVLVSGGVGQTPLLSMLKTVVREQPERKVWYIHAARNGQEHGMKEEVRQIVQRHDQVQNIIWYSRPTAEDVRNGSFDYEGYLDGRWLLRTLPSCPVDLYVCGPQSFVEQVARTVAARVGDCVFCERFGPGEVHVADSPANEIITPFSKEADLPC
ncbi:flavohemoprotein [Marinithermofilum abyssi]|uniref:Flavohemoprotein n=1 Tax=Marinithermofilum abyssi TaxID=1571185 RepID=A0A8J2VHZ6_9BACL|nr:NO-inducible flavohemoprotein [Marinithermofilum abyssi]GGE18777.1 flavohemoprotein [Marinithermofilum abyssi]